MENLNHGPDFTGYYGPIWYAYANHSDMYGRLTHNWIKYHKFSNAAEQPRLIWRSLFDGLGPKEGLQT